MITEQDRISIVKKAIKELVDRNPEYEKIIYKILDWEEKNADTDINNWGWQMKDIEGLNGGHIAQLREKGLIREGYFSNKYHHYYLNESRKIIRMALEQIEVEKMEIEKKTVHLKTNVDKYMDKFKRLKETGIDMLDYFSQLINPKVTGLETVKKALLLSIVSHTDKYGDRGRVHVLMSGDPGTAKSALMLWIHHYLGADYVTHRSTDVGLTGDASGTDITPGALPMADENVICIDELDKFSKKDFAGLLEAMSDGRVTITAGGKKKTFMARVRVIAGCNDTKNFPPELLDRFDFHFELETPNTEKEKEIVSTIVDTWFTPKGDYFGDELRAYISMIKDFEPEIPVETRKIAKALLQMYIDLRDKKGSIRKDESIMRVAFAIAKLHMRKLLPEDIIRAIQLIDKKVQGEKVRALNLLVQEKKKEIKEGIYE